MSLIYEIARDEADKVVKSFEEYSFDDRESFLFNYLKKFGFVLSLNRRFCDYFDYVDDDIIGALYRDGDRRELYVDRGLSSLRKDYSLSLLLGYVVLKENVVKSSSYSFSFSNSFVLGNVRDFFVQEFACCFLMPPNKFLKDYENCSDFSLLAKDYNVPVFLVKYWLSRLLKNPII